MYRIEFVENIYIFYKENTQDSIELVSFRCHCIIGFVIKFQFVLAKFFSYRLRTGISSCSVYNSMDLSRKWSLTDCQMIDADEKINFQWPSSNCSERFM